MNESKIHPELWEHDDNIDDDDDDDDDTAAHRNLSIEAKNTRVAINAAFYACDVVIKFPGSADVSFEKPFRMNVSAQQPSRFHCSAPRPTVIFTDSRAPRTMLFIYYFFFDF